MDTEEVSNDKDSMKQTKGVVKMNTQTLAYPCAPVYTRVTRKNVTITLNPELAAKAHQLGLNISKIAETALQNLVTTLQTSLPQEKATYWWAGRDLNSRPSACQAFLKH